MVTLLEKGHLSTENVQHLATKLVIEIKDLPYQDRLKILGLYVPSLQYGKDRRDKIQVYKILYDNDKLDTDLFFKKPVCDKT